MREQIETIPVNEAFDAGDECPFCYLQRLAEQRTVRYVAGPGASYMEPDVRGETDRYGFCSEHTKKLYDYGNSLGAALMLQTYFAGILKEFPQSAGDIKPPKGGLFGKRVPTSEDDYAQTLRGHVADCFICNRIRYHMDRYYTTFFYLLKDGEFRSKVEAGKGFCLKHFGELLEAARTKLPANQHPWFYDRVFRLEQENLLRVKEELDWLIAKHDYRNAKADWGNSRDALPRTMQKLVGIHPTDKPYKDE